MALRAKVTVQGLSELQKGLEQFGKSTQRGVLTRVLKKAAKPIENAAKDMAPVESGQLRDSIETVVLRSNPGKTAFARTMREGGSRQEAAQAARDANSVAAGRGTSATVRVQATAPHAHFAEFGTQSAPAHPFIGPALRAHEGPAVKDMASELKSEIEKTAKRVARRAAKKAG